MIYEEISTMFDILIFLVSAGYFTHGLFWKNTHSMTLAIFFTLIS